MRVAKLRTDRAGFIDRAAEPVPFGEARHFSETGWINRALKSLFTDLDSAATKVPDDVRERSPEIPWRELSEMRNLLAHNYESVQDRILWNTAVRHLPAMRAVLAEAAEEKKVTRIKAVQASGGVETEAVTRPALMPLRFTSLMRRRL